MKKAASIFLRSDVTKHDILQLSAWMKNADVTRYLNEHTDISRELEALLEGVPEPMLRQRLNANGRFYIVSLRCGRAVGFLSLRRMRAAHEREIVAAIGEPALWGAGIGARALRLALMESFYPRDSGISRIYATIHRENTRSMRLFLHAGFVPVGEVGASSRLVVERDLFFGKAL